MLASVHLVDGGARATLSALRRVPAPADTPGLREARALVASPIGGRLPAPQPGRSTRRTFHHAGSFVRFRPLVVAGHLDGRNPLPVAVTEALQLPVT